MTQRDQEIANLARRAVEGCHIQWQSGESVDHGWFELVGEGVSLLRQLLEAHGDSGLAEFKAQVEPILVERLQGQIKGYYDNQSMRDRFTALLNRYQGGQPVEVFIPIGPPRIGSSRARRTEELAVGRIPTGRPIVLQEAPAPTV